MEEFIEEIERIESLDLDTRVECFVMLRAVKALKKRILAKSQL